MNNSTVSSVHPEYSMAISYSFKVVFFVAISVVMLLSVFGNISVVISFLKHRTSKPALTTTSLAWQSRIFFMLLLIGRYIQVADFRFFADS